MLRRLIGEDIELATALDPGLWRVKADPGQIEQVILNLVVNARDAMPRRGQPDDRDRQRRAGRGVRAARHAERRSRARTCMLAVSDTGHGMDARRCRRSIFEPFFTTKEPGKGTGLGPGDGVRHRQAERRAHLGLQRARARHDVQDLPAAGGGGAGDAAPARRPRPAAAAGPRRCCSSRTTTRCARLVARDPRDPGLHGARRRRSRSEAIAPRGSRTRARSTCC